jgi:hypothetical protein
MLLSVIPLQAFGDHLLTVLAARVTMLGEHLRVTFSRQHRADNRHSGDAGDIRDHMRE